MDKTIENNVKTLMHIVDSEIVKNAGAGFKVELNPVIYQQKRYRSAYKFLSKELTWKYESSNYIDYCPYYLISSYPDSAYVSQNYLPQGIVCEKTEVGVLEDDRLSHSPPTEAGKSATCTIGQRVYLSVSDEYAAKYFKEEYTDIGYPFRDKLLSSYSHLLNNIVQSLIKPTDHVYFVVSEESIRSGYVFNRMEYNHKSVSFESQSMVPLNSSSQLYGMALALTETIKKDFPYFKDHIVTVRSNPKHNKIGKLLRIELIKPEDPKVLAEW